LAEHVAQLSGAVKLTFQRAAVTVQAETSANSDVILDELLHGDQVATAQTVPNRDATGAVRRVAERSIVDGEAEGQGHVTGHRAATELVPGVLILPGGELSARR